VWDLVNGSAMVAPPRTRRPVALSLGVTPNRRPIHDDRIAGLRPLPPADPGRAARSPARDRTVLAVQRGGGRRLRDVRHLGKFRQERQPEGELRRRDDHQTPPADYPAGVTAASAREKTRNRRAIAAVAGLWSKHHI